MTSPFRTSAFKGALFSVAMRWIDRLLGLGSTLVLARLLAPTDFGLVAMAMLVVGLIDVFLDLGVGAALIQNKSADRQDFDTAWTLRMCQALTAATLIVAGAPFVADYYGDARVADIMRVSAASIFIGGLENIGTVKFQKEMEFGREFRFLFARRALSTTVTIMLAFSLRSYWALVIGSLFSRVIGVTLSYLMHEFRPRVSLSRLRRIWSFSQWMLVFNIGAYANSRLDKLIVAKRADAGVLGAYTVGDEIATMPTGELLAPLGRVIFPLFALVREDAEELRRLFLLAFGIQALIGIPAGVGVALIANEAVPFLLGEQWEQAIAFVQVIAIANVAAAMSHSGGYLLMSLGRAKWLGVLHWLQFSLLLMLVTAVLPNLDAHGIALIRMGVAFVGLLLTQLFVRLCMRELRVRDVLDVTWRPLVSVAIMAAVVDFGLQGIIGSEVEWVLGAKIILGSLTYAGSVFLLWRLAGCPVGAEAYVIDKICPPGWREKLSR